jgi:hypothetical protein
LQYSVWVREASSAYCVHDVRRRGAAVHLPAIHRTQCCPTRVAGARCDCRVSSSVSQSECVSRNVSLIIPRRRLGCCPYRRRPRLPLFPPIVVPPPLLPPLPLPPCCHLPQPVRDRRSAGSGCEEWARVCVSVRWGGGRGRVCTLEETSPS